MRGIKIPQQDFALKMQGGLMREGGRICGRLRYSPHILFAALQDHRATPIKCLVSVQWLLKQ